MYIYAYPVQQSIAALIPNVSIPMMIVLSFIITFILSFLSWHIIEKKALKMKDHYVIFEKFFQKRKLVRKSQL
jgi:peptidoglycan/LPS O-acetylase OafA/YrhL